jgi:type IV pilus assembly protein PilA
MLRTLKNRTAKTGERDQGFTLIELMVVVMIIAVLLAIAIPTFLGSKNKAEDRSAQSSLRNTVTAARTIYTDGSDYSKATDAALKAAEPSLAFVAAGTASADPKTVSVNGATSTGSTPATVFYAAAKSKGGSCYYIRDDVNAGTTYYKVGATGTCTGTAAAAVTATDYKADGWS